MKIKIRNGSQNKLFTLAVGNKIRINYITIDLFTLSYNWNQNELNSYILLKDP